MASVVAHLGYELRAVLEFGTGCAEGEVLNLLGIWRGASFANVIQQTGFGEPGRSTHGDQTTCLAAHA